MSQDPNALLREAKQTMLTLAAGKPVRDLDEQILRINAYLAHPPMRAEEVRQERWFDGGIALNAAQLRSALDFLGGDEESEIILKHLRADQAEDGEGVYCWCSDYPQEGSMKLDLTKIWKEG